MKRGLIPWRKRDVEIRRPESDSLTGLQRRMDDVFEDFFRSLGGFPAMGSGLFAMDGLSPSFEVSETDNAIEVKAELPGMDEKDIDVSLDDRVLTIRGEKTEEREEKKRHTLFSERSFGSFQRTIPLPEDVLADMAKARFRKGVLSISIPKSKRPDAERRSITIEAGG